MILNKLRKSFEQLIKITDFFMGNMHEKIRNCGYQNPSETGLIVKGFFESMYIDNFISSQSVTLAIRMRGAEARRGVRGDCLRNMDSVK